MNYNDTQAVIKELENILANDDVKMKIIRDELISIKEKYGDDRRTEIIPAKLMISISKI